MQETIKYEDFEKVKILSGIVVKVEEFPKAKKPALKVWVDFGDKVGVLQTSAQIAYHYNTVSLLGKRVMGCTNLGEKNIAGFISQFLLLGFEDENGAIVLATLDKDVPNGNQLK